jgi:formylmethanofuran dehydrogenase subunit E
MGERELYCMTSNGEMTTGKVLAQAAALGVPEHLQRMIGRCSEFHTYPAPGLVMGAFMVDWAMEGLGATPGEKLFAVAETKKCLPDALQVIARCTIGNNRLRVLNSGRFAIAMNRPSTEKTSKGVRVAVDGAQLEAFPALRAWFLHDRAFDRKTMTGTLFDEILGGGRRYLAIERVQVRFDPRQDWSAGRCDCCGETVPDTLLRRGVCAACGQQRYYEPLSI